MSIQTLSRKPKPSAGGAQPVGSYRALVARDVGDLGDQMLVRVPAFDDGRLLRGPYDWPAHGVVLPQQNDHALVTYPDDGSEPIVVWWKPA